MRKKSISSRKKSPPTIYTNAKAGTATLDPETPGADLRPLVDILLERGDATSRAVLLALRVLAGEPGCPTALTAPKWGFQDALLKGRPLTLSRSLGSSVIEQILFKISSSAEPHLQTAIEAAGKLHSQVAPRLGEVERIEIATHEAGLRFRDPPDPHASPGERKYCLPYVAALGLVFRRQRRTRR